MATYERIYTTKAKRFLHGGDYNPDQWLDQPGILDDDVRLMRLAHTNTFSIGIFAWHCLEPEEGVYQFEWLDDVIERIASIGGHVILATPSGARPTWMSAKYPEVLRTNSSRVKQLHGARHNHCFTSPVYREKTQQMNRLLAERYGDHPALIMWHISNEYGGDCHCDLCQDAFRTWLQDQYSSLKELNDSWWGPFWSHTYTEWSQIESPSPIGESAVHGMNLDWKRFVTHQTIDFYKHEIVPLRERTPNIPITTNFMADTFDLIPFQSLDYSEFAKHVDVISWDAYPAWHNDWESTANLAMKVGMINDLYRSLKQQPFLLMESTPSAVNWHPVNKAKRPGMHKLSSLQMLAHGSDSVLYFQWRKSRGSSEKFHGAVVDHDNSPDNRVFKEVSEVGVTLEKIQEVVGSVRPAEVALFYDWESNWALDDAQGFGLDSKRYPQTLQEHYRTFWEQDIPVDVITKEHDFSSYRLLVVPMLYLMEESLAERFEQFVQDGGTIVMTYMSGLVDRHDLVHPNGWLTPLQNTFGVTPLETDTLYPSERQSVRYGESRFELKDYATPLRIETAQSLAVYEDEFYAGTAAVTKHTHGKGDAYYIGARMDQAFHRTFYGRLLDELNIHRPVAIKHRGGVSVQVRRAEDTDYIFVLNFTESRQTIELPYEMEDLVTGVKHTGTVELDRYASHVFKATR